MNRIYKILPAIILLIVIVRCTQDLPELKVQRKCVSPATDIVGKGSINNKYSREFKILGSTDDIAQVVWIFRQNGDTLHVSKPLTSIQKDSAKYILPSLIGVGRIDFDARITTYCDSVYTRTSFYEYFPTEISKFVGSSNMVTVDGGTFKMGGIVPNKPANAVPVHDVTLSKYQIAKYEVTQEFWTLIMGANPSFYNNCAKCPVESFLYVDLLEFLARVKVLTNKNYRLPTEAEWEYAARGGKLSKNYLFAGSNTLSDVAWYSANSDAKTHEVGLKKANELGIYDMSGNVWEWVFDKYEPYPNTPQINPVSTIQSGFRIFRGGGWRSGAELCPLIYRGYNDIVKDVPTGGEITGFRLALTP